MSKLIKILVILGIIVLVMGAVYMGRGWYNDYQAGLPKDTELYKPTRR